MGYYVTFGTSLTHPVVLVWEVYRLSIALQSDRALGVDIFTPSVSMPG